MKFKNKWKFALLSLLISFSSAEAQTKSKSLPTKLEAARTLLLSEKPLDRIAGADLLAKQSYSDLRDVDLTDVCQDGPSTGDSNNIDCRYLNHMAYHLIGIYERFAKEETNPSSPNFCYRKSNNERECPFLAKLRWMIFNQFEQRFDMDVSDKKVSEISLKKMALKALERATKLDPRTPDALSPFAARSAENENLKWIYIEQTTNQGIYASPVGHHFVWDRKAKRFISHSHHLPFTKHPDLGFDYSKDPLLVRWVHDAAFVPNSQIGILRIDGECCGDDATLFHLFRIGKKITPLGFVRINTLDFPKSMNTWQRLMPVFERLKFLDKLKSASLTSTDGEVKIGERTVKFQFTAEKAVASESITQ